jgi:predicted aldo/keto reductase-like oxidoreductase
MRTVRLGKTGLMVSRVGMGGIPITRPAESEAVGVIRRALDLGVNFIDTARRYGASEERIGKAVAGRRERVIIATKTIERDKAGALQDLASSLRHLNTDFIDLWQFHGINKEEEYERILGPGGAMEAAQEALQAGTVRHVGISGHSLDVAFQAVRSGLFETIQFPFNFVNNDPAGGLVQLAGERDVGFIAMKPLAGGQLKNARLAIKYLLQFDNVVPDPGIQKVEEIEEIVSVVDGSWELTASEQQEMETIRVQLGRRFCQWCNYCMPCLQQVDIPMLMNVRTSGNYGTDFLSAMADAVESAKNCIQCGECEEKCPFHLPIREMIVENADYFASVRC